MIDSGRFRDGDPDYFARLVAEHGALVQDIVSAFAGSQDESDDLFQEVWIKVWRRRGTYHGGSFRTWLLVVARNHCRDRMRRHAVYARFLERVRGLPSPERPPSPLQRTIDEQRRAEVRRLVAMLPSRQREAILRKLDGDLTSDQIAVEMGIAPASVRSLISKGLAAIHDKLEKIS